MSEAKAPVPRPRTGDTPSPKPTGKLAMLESWSKILGAVGIPLLLAYFGHTISAQQQRADERERIRKDLLDLGSYLIDNDPRKHQFAAAIIEMMRNDNAEIPSSVLDMAASVSNSPSIQTANTDASMPQAMALPAAAPLADTPAQTAAVAAQRAVVDALGGLVPRVFIQISSDKQRPGAEALRQFLQQARVNGSAIVAPGVELIRKPPPKMELRYLRAADQPEAEQIAGQISSALNGQKPTLIYLKQFENDSNTRGRTYELWIPPEVELTAK